MVGDRTLPALPTEPLVGRCVFTDCEPEGLRLPAVFAHPAFKYKTKGKIKEAIPLWRFSFELVKQTFQPDCSEVVVSSLKLLLLRTFF